jgi:hypothetical protein
MSGSSLSPPGASNHGNNSNSSTNGNLGSRSHDISRLLSYAQTNYEENPTESLAALLQAVTLDSGPQAADQVMIRLRNELGNDLAEHIGSHHSIRRQRAQAVLQRLLQDESTELFRQGRQDILRQTMEDGSSVVCSRCNAVVASKRWQQHTKWWCSANDFDQDGTEEGKHFGDGNDAEDGMDVS